MQETGSTLYDFVSFWGANVKDGALLFAADPGMSTRRVNHRSTMKRSSFASDIKAMQRPKYQLESPWRFSISTFTLSKAGACWNVFLARKICKVFLVGSSTVFWASVTGICSWVATRNGSVHCNTGFAPAVRSAIPLYIHWNVHYIYLLNETLMYMRCTLHVLKHVREV